MNDELMSNFYHKINKDVESALVSGELLEATYLGWNFFAYVKYNPDNENFIADVWVHGQSTMVVTSRTTEELMEEICKEFGND